MGWFLSWGGGRFLSFPALVRDACVVGPAFFGTRGRVGLFRWIDLT